LRCRLTSIFLLGDARGFVPHWCGQGRNYYTTNSSRGTEVPARKARANGGLEQAVLSCLVGAGGPQTPAEVQAALGGTLAYTTVMTTLSRLHAKGALTRVPRGRAYAYEPIDDQAGVEATLAARQMYRLLDDAGSRRGVLARFVDALDEESERELRRLLARVDDGSGSPDDVQANA
jgi:predicted transcriptional regulator